MKLRLRNLETNETRKIEVQDPCSLFQLKRNLSDLFSLPSPSLHLSLNRKDELLEADDLRSLGIISGDLVFFSLNPNSFSSQSLLPQFGSCSGTSNVSAEALIFEPKSICGEQKTLTVEHNTEKEISKNYELGRNKTLVSDSVMGETLEPVSHIEETNCENKNPEVGIDETLICDSEHGTNQEISGESMEIDMDGADDVADGGTGKGFSVPGFLRKVFNKELGDNGGCDHKLVVIAIHAILTESGFLGFDLVSKTKLGGLYLPDFLSSSLSTFSLCYTLPEIVQLAKVVETVTVKVQNMGKYVNLYGSLAKKGSMAYRVCLDIERLAISLNLMWANLNTAMEGSGSVIYPDKEVFEFWKTVKDKLVLPLLIDLCDVANLPPPPSFNRLPTDMKLKILELLPGVHLAKAACVSPELQFLASDDTLWKQKFVEQFGDAELSKGSAVKVSWKRKFAKEWEARKIRKIGVARHRPVWIPRAYPGPVPSIFRVPGRIGGDYDRDFMPNIPMGGRLFGRHNERDFMPRCNFGDRRA